MAEDIQQRKDHHLSLCLLDEVRAPMAHSLDGVRLEYDCLPEMDFEEVDLSTRLFGRQLAAPLLIGAMTGGSEAGAKINRSLAEAAQQLGLGMCLGSQRAMIERPDLAWTYDVRAMAQDLPLVVGNLGAIQLNKGIGVAKIHEMMERVPLDVLALHLNPLQEVIQPGGDTNWRGLLDRLRDVVGRLKVDVILKEVGAGVSRHAAEKLATLPVAGIDAAGVGGTSWSMVEALRAGDSPAAQAGRSLAWFGVDTARSIQNCRASFQDRVVIGSGGISTGYHMAAALALGADTVAVSQPLLAAAREGPQEVVAKLETLLYELRVAMFCTGATNVPALRKVERTSQRMPEPES
jgi:isopentenyl-diphosphate Delta-isomerase